MRKVINPCIYEHTNGARYYFKSKYDFVEYIHRYIQRGEPVPHFNGGVLEQHHYREIVKKWRVTVCNGNVKLALIKT